MKRVQIHTLTKDQKNNIILVMLVLLIFFAMTILSPRAFLRPANLKGMAVQFPEFGILSFGMMIAMISGGIDLSLVGIANLSSIVAAVVMLQMGDSVFSIVLGILASLFIGALCGVFNGFLIGYLKIPAMLVTLCGLQLYSGLGLAITKGPALTGLPESYGEIANGAIIGGIPNTVLIFLVVAVAVAYLMRSTVYGSHVSFMGTNEVASKYSGINNLKVTMYTYIISGLMGSIGGILISSHYNSAKSDYGKSYTLLTLLIVVLGGTDPSGGKGNILGVSLAVIVLQMISSAFNILRVNSFVKTFVWGLILIGVMLVSRVIDTREKQERNAK
ncbi:MAG TPA: ABC transporter permease [Sphaerochaeta sp.]|jgi:simple sugar transport system permease protein|nr:ABC transporter permease [Sphaerochaeta sp.]HBO36579.1 ABC transporter permease [Sphaerochaeta sp.]